MKRKTIVIVTMIFMVSYGFCVTMGSMFLVSWGSKSWIKSILIFMQSFPIDWIKLSVETSFGFTTLNVIFWTIIFYITFTLINKLIMSVSKIE